MKKEKEGLDISFKGPPLHVGFVAEKDAVYKCTICGNLDLFRKGESLKRCEICYEFRRHNTWRMGRQLELATKHPREVERKKSVEDKASDVIIGFAGHMKFIYVHIFWFILWILLNVGFAIGFAAFDPYPFNLLTLVISIEAILLSSFIMISQNRQSRRADLRAELDYLVNLKAEKEIIHIREELKDMRKMLLSHGKHPKR
ncbi:MAG: DUF1003 domain-containing protein [Candidatus Aenigmarchaeota archaeon]|nr:DUF1003 domain-containing protein [Candidatus Aenigmarchaeota archaeon]